MKPTIRQRFRILDTNDNVERFLLIALIFATIVHVVLAIMYCWPVIKMIIR
nr:MAG TPA: hypothetical protein [Caudoviricetes sp.]